MLTKCSHFEFGAMHGKTEDDADAAAPSLAAASQSWNWLGLSQKNDESSSSGNSAPFGRLNSAQSRRNAPQTKSKSKRPLLLNRTPTSTQSEPKPKTISTATERAKPAKPNSKAVEEFSKLRIADRTISVEALRQEMEGRKFIKLQQMDRVPKDTFTNGEVRFSRNRSRFILQCLGTWSLTWNFLFLFLF